MDQPTSSVLREEQAALEEFFATLGWQLLLRRFLPRQEALSASIDSVQDLRSLGDVQGQRKVLREIVELEGILASEISDALVQAEGQDDITDAQWRG